MHPAVKILGGIILVVIGLGLFLDSLYSHITRIAWLDNFLIVLTGIIPIFLILLGLFVVWLEIDELKTLKELEAEEKRKRRKK
ncbi:MAG: hypothetical protein DRP12_00500 [Candidatus Aenigmatarchaeota archaeon]|mgnify:CR=1 FL=1|nr:MAG: hypothetical protein DRP12_00500 [Candidatus Aenigmarchaeota archaeon]